MVWRVSKRRPGCLLGLVFILYIFIVCALQASAAHSAGDRIFQGKKNDHIFLSSELIRRALGKLANRRIQGESLREYISDVHASTNNQTGRIKGTRPPETCTDQRRERVSAARSLISDQDVTLSDEPCPYVFSYSGQSENAPTRKRDLSLALHLFASLFRKALRSPGLNFSKWGFRLATNFMFFTVRSTESFRCELSVDCVIELHNRTFFLVLVQSYNPRDGARKHSSLLEVVATDLKSVMPRHHDSRNETQMPCTSSRCKNFSTLFEKTTGLGTFSYLIPMQLHKVPLLGSTVEETEDKFALANSVFEDLTASNIAILALPLVLCFIPISPMADVSQTTMHIYALVTDLFSAVPLIVKGAEVLIKFNSNSHKTHSETWVFGSGGARLTEIWSTQCRIAVDRGTGAVIIVSALWAITVGLVTEYLAWRWVAGREKNEKHVTVLRERNYIRRVGQDTYQVRSKYLTKMLNGTSSTDYYPSSVACSLDSPPSPVPYSDDDLPGDEVVDDQVRTSRISSLFSRSNVRPEDDDSISQPWKSFFLGVCLGILLLVFSYFYLHCLGGVQRSRRKRKFYFWGMLLGSLFWGPIVYFSQRLM